MRQHMFRERLGLLLVATMFLFLIVGCGPQNAEEFRRMVRSSTWLSTTAESLEVSRPFKDVTETLRQKSEECLDVTVRLICADCIGSRSKDAGERIFWKPTLITTSERTELHLRRTGHGRPAGTPSDGSYEAVLDAVPIDKARTKIDIYTMNPFNKFIYRAMRGWVTGDNMGCPDMTKAE